MSQIHALLFDEFSKLPLFQGVPPGDLEQLLQVAHRKQCQAGEFFFLQDDPAQNS